MAHIFHLSISEEIVYLKSQCLIPLVVALALAWVGVAARPQSAPADSVPATSGETPAQPASPASPAAPHSSPAAAQAAPAATGTLHGHISDPTGALIPGAQVSVATAAGTNVANVTADAAGDYQVRGLAAGSYVIEANFTGFAPFVSAPIPLNSGETKNIDIKMAIEAAEEQVVVTSESGPTVGTEAGANSNSIVLKGSDLDALSDDPDELSNELTALAGPAAAQWRTDLH